MHPSTHEDPLFLRANACQKLGHFLEFLDCQLYFSRYFRHSEQMQVDLLARLAQRPVLTPVFALVLCN